MRWYGDRGIQNPLLGQCRHQGHSVPSSAPGRLLQQARGQASGFLAHQPKHLLIPHPQRRGKQDVPLVSTLPGEMYWLPLGARNGAMWNPLCLALTSWARSTVYTEQGSIDNPPAFLWQEWIHALFLEKSQKLKLWCSRDAQPFSKQV